MYRKHCEGLSHLKFQAPNARGWISLRAAWLRLPEKLVAEEPKSFEEQSEEQRTS